MTKRLKIITFLIIMNIIAICALGIKSLIGLIDRYTPAIYELGNLEEKGYVGAVIKYDKEPATISLISPTNKEISTKNMSLYDENENTKTTTVMYDTLETGKWKIKITQKKNESITFKFLQGKSPTIHMDDFGITQIGQIMYVTFIPVMLDQKFKTCDYTLLLKNDKKSFALPSGSVMLNKKAFVPILPDENAFTGESYDLTVNISSPDKDKPSHETRNVKVVLPKKIQKIKDKEVNEEIEDGDKELHKTDD